MDSVVGKTFRDKEIVIDSKTAYVSCTFSNCHLIYMGGDFSFLTCTIEPNCKATVTGDAGKVVMFMQMVGMFPPMPAPALPPVQMPDSGTLH
jgi:hypothetical protein